MGIDGRVNRVSIKQYHQAHLLECEEERRELDQSVYGWYQLSRIESCVCEKEQSNIN